MYKTLIVVNILINFVSGEVKLVEEVAKPVAPKQLKDVETIKFLGKLIKENKWNLTFIYSHETYFPDSKTKATASTSVTFPLAKEKPVPITESQREELFKKAKSDQLLVRITNFEDNNTWLNSKKALPASLAYEKFSRTDPAFSTWQDKNYILHYTFKNGDKTTKIAFGDLELKVIEKENFTDEEIEKVKKSVAYAYFTYNDSKFEEALVALLKKNFPKQKWQVATNIKNGYLKAKKSITIKVVNYQIVIYAV